MRNFVILVFVLYLCQNATAFCCFRDPWMLPTAPCTTCATGSTCGNIAPSPCGCDYSCKCYRDPDNVCNVCDPPSPICECMPKCGCEDLKYPIYFPEVEYPVTIAEMDPYFYRSCWSA